MRVKKFPNDLLEMRELAGPTGKTSIYKVIGL